MITGVMKYDTGTPNNVHFMYYFLREISAT